MNDPAVSLAHCCMCPRCFSILLQWLLAREPCRFLCSAAPCPICCRALGHPSIVRPVQACYKSCAQSVVSVEGCKQYIDSAGIGWNHSTLAFRGNLCDMSQAWITDLNSYNLHLSLFCRDNPSTWFDKHWPPTFKGIINVLEIAHQEFVWKIRSYPKVIEASSRLGSPFVFLTKLSSCLRSLLTKQGPCAEENA